MKNILIILGLALMVSCGSEKGNDNLLEQIAGHKDKIRELESEIASMEGRLDMDSVYAANNVQKIPVRVRELRYGTFNHFVELTGVVEAKQAAYISPEINGQIKEINVAEGQRVKKGDQLARINTSITESSIREVKTSLELAKVLYEKQKSLWDKKIGSEIDYLQAKTNKESLENRLQTLEAQYEMAIVRAPFDGIVDEIYQKAGELAVPGIQLMQLVNLGTVILNSDVSEAYLSKVKKGDVVTVTFPSFPDFERKAPVSRVGNVIKQANRTFNIEIQLANPSEILKPNMLGVILFNDYTADSSIIVPTILIKQDINGNSYLYRAVTDNGRLIAEKVIVKTGMAYKDQTEITEGLKEGDQVIIVGFDQVSDGVNIEIK